MMVSRDTLSILACPACKGELLLSDDQQRLLCRTCALEFPIRDGIPVLLVETGNGDNGMGLNNE